MTIHPLVSDALMIPNYGPRLDLCIEDHIVTVDIHCGAAVLRGDDVFLLVYCLFQKVLLSLLLHSSFVGDLHPERFPQSESPLHQNHSLHQQEQLPCHLAHDQSNLCILGWCVTKIIIQCTSFL